MADNREQSRADDLFEILNEFDDNADAQKAAAQEAAPSVDETAEPSAKDVYFNELVEILSKEPEPEIAPEQEEESENSCGIDCEEEIPDSIFNHLSDEGADRVIPVTNENESHFTDDLSPQTEEEQNPPENNVVEEGGEEEKTEKKGKKALQKLGMIPKAVIYLAAVIILSLYLAFNIIVIGNDVFALVCDAGEVTITIPENADDKTVAQLLKDNGVVDYAFVYELYMKYRGDGDETTEYIAGEHKLDLSYNYSQIITALTSNIKARKVERVTIPEGQTIDEIIDILVEKGIGTKAGYVEAINEYPYKWEFVQKLDEMGYSENRKYRLEGYLYPDTYEFYTDSSEVSVVNKMLAAFNEKFWKDFTAKNSDGESYQEMALEEYGMTFDDIVVLASMVQSEGKNIDDFYNISYVFHNRLSHEKSFPYLQSDATLQYILAERIQDSGELRNELETNENPYNSYKHKGLPPGAISNPGTDALFAALFPTKPSNTDAYYFVSNDAGKTYYASTESGHEKNKKQVEKDNAAIEEGTYEG